VGVALAVFGVAVGENEEDFFSSLFFWLDFGLWLEIDRLIINHEGVRTDAVFICKERN